MIELFSITLQLLCFLLIFSFPFNPAFLNKIIFIKNNQFNYADCYAVNIIFILNLLLIFSFLNIDIKLVFLILLALAISFFVINIKEINKSINKKFIMRFIFFIILFYSMSINMAHELKIEWDGFHWITKALVFLNNEEIKNLRSVDMPMYPHLGGYIWALFWENSFLKLEYFGRLFPIFFYLISIFSIFNLLRFKSQKVLYTLVFLTIYFTHEQYLFAGYQEYYIFSILLISSRYIATINFNQTYENKKIFLVLLTMSLMMWFKDEGMFYYIIFGVLLVLTVKINILYRLIFLLFIISTISLQYYLQKYVIGFYSFNSEIINNEIIYQLLDLKYVIIKTLAISKHMVIAFIKYPLWLLIIFSLSFLFVKFRNKELTIKYFTYALILNFLFLFAVYLHDPNKDYEFLLRVTLDRLIFQASGFYLILVIYLINRIKI